MSKFALMLKHNRKKPDDDASATQSTINTTHISPESKSTIEENSVNDSTAKPTHSTHAKPETAITYGSLHTTVPDNMAEASAEAMRKLRAAVGGDLEGFVAERLQMSRKELSQSLMQEQIDGVALAIYNIEARNQGLIIGDQTGVGKGRQAAAVVRYALAQGMMPIFVTARAYLFSDFYRDAKALGISDKQPFVVNSDARVVDYTQAVGEYVEPIRQEDETDEEFDARMITAQANAYKVVFRGADKNLMTNDGAVPYGIDYIMTTYSQFNRARRTNRAPKRIIRVDKGAWLMEVARNRKCVFIMDESHTAAGVNSNTGIFFRKVLSLATGALFLSATFAKRPENMSIYAAKTVIGECNMPPSDLTSAMQSGGVPLQELMARNLARHGQMIRRERANANCEVRYISLDKAGADDFGITDTSVLDCANSDVVTDIVRRMVRFQQATISPIANSMEIAERKRLDKLFNNSTVTASCVSPFDRLYLLIESMLLAVKSRNIAERTLRHVAEGRKVVICVSKTGESTLRTLVGNADEPMGMGTKVDGGFRSYLLGLVSTITSVRLRVEVKNADQMRRLQEDGYVTVPTENGFFLQKVVDVRPDLLPASCNELAEVEEHVKQTCVDLPLSPIDYIRHIIEGAGQSVGECTGRTMRLIYESDDVSEATLDARRHADVSATFNRFQNNVIDVMIINSSASTGASCHAVPTDLVPESEVKQRVMIIAQPELDVSVEVQKRGRVNRTGQLSHIPPIYEYITSAIPAEQRILMTLKRKLKSLDANTSANQRQNDHMLDYPDFMNSYGDEFVASTWMPEHIEECMSMDLPLPQKNHSGYAAKVAGRIAVLSCESQDDFYRSVYEGHDEAVRRAKAEGSYNLECEKMDLQARYVSEQFASLGFGGAPFFGGDVMLKLYDCRMTSKPYKFDEMLGHIAADIEAHGDYNDLIEQTTKFYDTQVEEISEATASRMSEKHVTPSMLSEIYEKVKRKVGELGKNQNAVLTLLNKMRDIAAESGNNIERRLELSTFVGEHGEPMVLTGVRIANKAKPFLPSSVVAQFDVCNSTQRIELNCVTRGDRPFTFQDIFSKPYGRSSEAVREEWNDLRAQSQTRMVRRAIMTGNLLTAYGLSAFNSVPKHAIYYTTEEGETKTGLLLSADYKRQMEKNSRGVMTVSLPLTDRVIGLLMSSAVATNIIGCHGSFFYQSERRSTHWVYNPDGTRKLELQMGYSITFKETPELSEFLDEQPKINSMLAKMMDEGFSQESVRELLKSLAEFKFAVQLPKTLFAENELEEIRAEVKSISEPWPTIEWDASRIPQ